MTPEQPSNTPEINDINVSTVEIAEMPPITYKIGNSSYMGFGIFISFLPRYQFSI